MNRWLCAAIVIAGCGGKDPVTPDAYIGPRPDAPPSTCQPVSAVGQFYRRSPNPRMISGTHSYPDHTVDIAITDPDLRWDDASSTWQLYYHGPNAASYQAANTPMIRHAESPDLATWTIDDAPALVAGLDSTAWDHMTTETPSVVYNPDAIPERRYLMMYSGANAMFGTAGFPAYAIGAAFSSDGKTFTRIAATDSPDGQEGLVLTAGDAYFGMNGVVADPEILYVDHKYHLWFSSYACAAQCTAPSAYGIAHATSTDGIHWQVAEAPVKSLLQMSAVPTSGGGQPTVIYDDVHCRFEMWLRADATGEANDQPIVFNNMVGLWHATSPDGITWSVNYAGTRDLAWNSATPDDGEHLGLLTGADVAVKGGSRYMVYSGFDNQNVPTGFALPDRSQQGYESGVITLNVAARDAL